MPKARRPSAAPDVEWAQPTHSCHKASESGRRKAAIR
jgi:hypothetical protein